MLDDLTDDQLDEHRREVLKEQERRKKLEDGLELIGQVVSDYMDAARMDCPDKENLELGELVVDLLSEYVDDDDRGS